MAEWFISCHAGQPADKKDICKIPGKMKLYFYVSDGEILSMNAGWKLWSVLMYGDLGGVATAKRQAIYVKDRTQHCYNYKFYRNPGEVWNDTDPNHHAVNALGIFTAGNYMPPAAAPAPVGPAIPVDPAMLDLTTIVAAAAAQGIWDIHIGTCRERWGPAKNVTPRWLA